MERMKIVSSNIAEIGYVFDSHTLEIKFVSGGLYQYLGVPRSIYEHFVKAESKGRFFAEHIKNVYKFRKVSK